jgi:hypothetical protein
MFNLTDPPACLERNWTRSLWQLTLFRHIISSWQESKRVGPIARRGLMKGEFTASSGKSLAGTMTSSCWLNWIRLWQLAWSNPLPTHPQANIGRPDLSQKNTALLPVYLLGLCLVQLDVQLQVHWGPSDTIAYKLSTMYLWTCGSGAQDE